MDIDSFKKDTIKEFLDAIKNNDGDLLVYIANDFKKFNLELDVYEKNIILRAYLKSFKCSNIEEYILFSVFSILDQEFLQENQKNIFEFFIKNIDSIESQWGTIRNVEFFVNDLNKHNVYVTELSEEVVGFIKKHKYIMPEEIYTLVSHQKELYLQNNINAANNIKKIKI